MNVFKSWGVIGKVSNRKEIIGKSIFGICEKGTTFITSPVKKIKKNNKIVTQNGSIFYLDNFEQNLRGICK